MDGQIELWLAYAGDVTTTGNLGWHTSAPRLAGILSQTEQQLPPDAPPAPVPRCGSTQVKPRVSATSGLRAEPVGGRLAASSRSALLYSLNAPEAAMAAAEYERRQAAAVVGPPPSSAAPSSAC